MKIHMIFPRFDCIGQFRKHAAFRIAQEEFLRTCGINILPKTYTQTVNEIFNWIIWRHILQKNIWNQSHIVDTFSSSVQELLQFWNLVPKSDSIELFEGVWKVTKSQCLFLDYDTVLSILV